MKTFTDHQGRLLKIRINVNAIQDVLGELNLDLRRPDDPQSTQEKPLPTLTARLMADPLLFLDLLRVFVRKQLEEANIDPKEWFGDLDAHVIGAAREAFFEEWADFFHGLKMSYLADQMTTERTFQAKVAEHMLEKMKTVDLNNLPGLIQSVKSTTSPESLELTPAL